MQNRTYLPKYNPAIECNFMSQLTAGAHWHRASYARSQPSTPNSQLSSSPIGIPTDAHPNYIKLKNTRAAALI